MKRFIFLLVLAVSAGACSRSGDAGLEPSASAADISAADRELQEAAAEAGAPQDALQKWADAMEARDWAAVRAFWGRNGETSGMSEEEFAAAYERFRTVEISLGEGREESANGVDIYEAQVVMRGELQDGAPYLMGGPVVLRRVSGVPGASSDEKMWHIEISGLRQVPVEPE